MRLVSLAGFLFLFWLALSGQYVPMLIGAGVVCTAVCVYAAIRMNALDRDGHPVELLPRALSYYSWLVVEMVKSSWTVARIVLHPSLPISPVMTVVEAKQKTAAGLATYANSITLTPGTVTSGVSGSKLVVHALTRDGADDLEAGEMNRRVAVFEGGK